MGKTTTAANLAVALARHGRVLAVDVDPQDSLGRAFGVVAKSADDSLAGFLDDPTADARAAVRHDVAPGVDLLREVADERGLEVVMAPDCPVFSVVTVSGLCEVATVQCR